MEGPPLAKTRHDLRHGAQKEGCHDRCFQQGLGSAVRWQTDIRSLVQRGVWPAHQLPRNARSVSGLSVLLARHLGTTCASTLRQQVCGVIHKLTGSHITLQPKTGCPLKLSRVEPGQYLDGRPPEKTKLLLEEVLVRPAGGAHPVVCVGPNAPV